MTPPENPECPYCGAGATDESIRNKRLESIGYLHTDVRYDCSECDGSWVHGVPRGDHDSDKWVCDSCGGDYMPHFLFVDPGDKVIETRPKCQECSHAPESYIEIDSKFQGDNIRGFVSHHTVTGDRTKADGDPI